MCDHPLVGLLEIVNRAAVLVRDRDRELDLLAGDDRLGCRPDLDDVVARDPIGRARVRARVLRRGATEQREDEHEHALLTFDVHEISQTSTYRPGSRVDGRSLAGHPADVNRRRLRSWTRRCARALRAILVALAMAGHPSRERRRRCILQRAGARRGRGRGALWSTLRRRLRHGMRRETLRTARSPLPMLCCRRDRSAGSRPARPVPCEHLCLRVGALADRQPHAHPADTPSHRLKPRTQVRAFARGIPSPSSR